MMAKVTVYHLVGITVVVTLGLLWMYRKVRKVEKRMNDLDRDLNAFMLASSSYKEQPKSTPSPPVPVNNVCRLNPVQVDPVCETMSVTSEDMDAIHQELQQQPAPSSKVQEEEEDFEQDEESEEEEEDAADDEEEVVKGTDDPQAPTHEQSPSESEPFILHFNNSPKAWTLTEEELKKKTVEDLRQYLKSRGLPITGAKQVLITRIIASKE
jgi:uncharacterized protein with von Willebrand factor type A (vWA) domain